MEIDGDTLAVAAYHDPTRHVDGGAVYVFARSDEEWLLEARLFPADGAAADEFGTAIALQGDTLIVGSPGDDGGGTNAGAAIVYRRVAGTWERESVLRAPDGVEFDAFGFSVGLAGTARSSARRSMTAATWKVAGHTCSSETGQFGRRARGSSRRACRRAPGSVAPWH